ncbi:uncharacterized protein VICG_00654 [Vittaforma corneae ATCC 50505]|uniref:Uncharacterized protein n=1 Tax=Vittaforma corneae (strain ATCC 50505) TaxID=993615 RepID=L2GP23_VITCO|nr:uncharacterized protein VICG_00654 [Vittaforma corneae ATCC 50505]ELA42255.1 hypothetical protein VICG_00654 [Vittaforma corneae ATCC 50505]
MSTKKLSNFGAVASIVSSTLGCGITLMIGVYLYLGKHRCHSSDA